MEDDRLKLGTLVRLGSAAAVFALAACGAIVDPEAYEDGLAGDAGETRNDGGFALDGSAPDLSSETDASVTGLDPGLETWTGSETCLYPGNIEGTCVCGFAEGDPWEGVCVPEASDCNTGSGPDPSCAPRGDSCTPNAPNGSTACRGGLVCFRGFCQEPCRLDDGDGRCSTLEVGAECLEVGHNVFGVCGRPG